MDIWWFSTGRLCGYVDNMMDECFWVLWLSLPLVSLSYSWFKSCHIPSPVWMRSPSSKSLKGKEKAIWKNCP